MVNTHSKAKARSDSPTLLKLSPDPDCVPGSSLDPVYRELMSFLRLPAAERPHNIAIAGDYATGKSSLLQRAMCEFEVIKRPWCRCHVIQSFFRRFGSRRCCISISLLTKTQSSDSWKPKDDEITLEQTLEKEMFKQLLYSVKPSHLKHAHGGRLMPYSIVREILKWLAYLILFLPIAMLIVDNITGKYWTFGIVLSKIFGEATSNYWIQAMSSNALLHTLLTSQSAFRIVLLLLIVIFSVIVGTCVLHIDTFSAKIADMTITMQQQSAKDESFFDLYLDQIVYLLERSKTEVVILEDIDRTQSMKFFESLRELNDILNKDLTRKRHCITFIYAMSDTLFDYAENEHNNPNLPAQMSLQDEKREKGSAKTVVASTITSAKSDHEIMNVIQNKAKFFDVILYVSSINDAATVPVRIKALMESKGISNNGGEA